MSCLLLLDDGVTSQIDVMLTDALSLLNCCIRAPANASAGWRDGVGPANPTRG